MLHNPTKGKKKREFKGFHQDTQVEAGQTLSFVLAHALFGKSPVFHVQAEPVSQYRYLLSQSPLQLRRRRVTDLANQTHPFLTIHEISDAKERG